jgi:adenine-specific DNA-methyltransferase
MSVQLLQGDCLELMRAMPDNSVDLIATDPPYYKVKGEAWDRQWDTPELFIAWIAKLCEQWQRILKPNGSLYVFASPQMAARVEVEIGRWFTILTRITWNKPPYSTKAEMFRKEDLRSYFPSSEAIVFAEQKGFVFEPLRGYLDSERQRAGISYKQVNAILGMPVAGGGMATHYFSGPDSAPRIQWALPTKEHYEMMRDGFSRLDHGGKYLEREHEDLRQEFEGLRRPFNVSPDVPYTDGWTFKTVGAYAGKHPCEKPLDMMRHIITASSKPNAVVLDCFMGSGVTGQAARELGRSFIGIELDAKYFAQAKTRIETTQDAFALEVTL